MADREDTAAELESRIAFLEDTVETLSREVAHQNSEIASLKTAVRYLGDRLRECAVSNVALPEEETPPPHY
ncbi:MAG: SlyX family protein [Succinivibrionaceae bacterium]|nr:SlyX family protein [Succinivibrionaceae bacterium]